MPKTFTITLGGDGYVCHRFNIGELEKIADLTDSLKPATAGFAILKLALARATPPVADPDSLEASADEINRAITLIMVSAGLKAADPLPGESSPATAADR